MIVLITGGSKSGKSTYAENLALSLAKGSPVTMQVIDEEDQAIVKRHKKQREGRNYVVLEQEKGLSTLPISDGATILLEDIPNLLANEMFGGGQPDTIIPDLNYLSSCAQHLVIITNEVGSDGIAYDAETIHYLTALNQLNRSISAMSDEVIEVVCGIPLHLKGEPV